MKQYGIVDTGSNTIVLIVYEIQEGRPIPVRYYSDPVHLIDYVKDGALEPIGIEKAKASLMQYAEMLDTLDIESRHCDITEPCRVLNASELISALEETGFVVHPLSGAEEAACDFIGAKLSYPSLKDGVAFDVGGGSTELISFQDNEIVDAMSFHLGCVRLAHLPLDTSACMEEIEKAAAQYPSLAKKQDQLIAIGGTAKFATHVIEALHGQGKTYPVAFLKDLFDRLCDKEPAAVSVMKQIVNPARQPLFLPGIHMILEISRFYGAKTLCFSDTGIREGFFMKHVMGMA